MNEIKKILLHFGNKNQKKKVIEELSELIKAIIKDNRKNIIEEIADVEIMLEQLKMIYLIDFHEIQSIKDEKIKKVLFKIKSHGGI